MKSLGGLSKVYERRIVNDWSANHRPMHHCSVKQAYGSQVIYLKKSPSMESEPWSDQGGRNFPVAKIPLPAP